MGSKGNRDEQFFVRSMRNGHNADGLPRNDLRQTQKYADVVKRKLDVLKHEATRIETYSHVFERSSTYSGVLRTYSDSGTGKQTSDA